MHYSESIAEKICERLIEGESMRQICQSEGFPSRASVLRWMADNKDFEAKCARAREMQADLMDDKIIEAAEACDEENYQSTKVKISAYQWRASKLAPKKYGDKLAHTGENGGAIELVVRHIGSESKEE